MVQVYACQYRYMQAVDLVFTVHAMAQLLTSITFVEVGFAGIL